MGSLTGFESKREEQFSTVQSGSVYEMTLRLYRTQDLVGSSPTVAHSRFEMYENETAFGASMASTANDTGAQPDFSHVTPPYYNGSAEVTFYYTASYSGRPTLDEIFTNTNLHFNRAGITSNFDSLQGSPAPLVPYGTSDRVMQIDQSFNLLEAVQTVPVGTTDQKNQWLIQSKYECPILNFANVSQSFAPATVPSPAGPTSPGTITPATLNTRGMWHQYGAIPTGSGEGVFVEIAKLQTSNPSLATIVGFSEGTPQRVGTVNQEYLLEEAIVAIPYKPSKIRRNFIKFTNETKQSRTYQQLTNAMQKYIFPPRFDFMQFNTVDPILMYVFEFSAKLSQQDLADIWQNLPPSISEKFETKEAVVEEKELLDLILDKEANTQWMVFKVKKRGIKDYEKYRRSLISTADLSAFPDTIQSPYSYNWPYDYFSLVELAKMDEKVQYASQDLRPFEAVTPERGPGPRNPVGAPTTITPPAAGSQTTRGPAQGTGQTTAALPPTPATRRPAQGAGQAAAAQPTAPATTTRGPAQGAGQAAAAPLGLTPRITRRGGNN